MLYTIDKKIGVSHSFQSDDSEYQFYDIEKIKVFICFRVTLTQWVNKINFHGIAIH